MRAAIGYYINGFVGKFPYGLKLVSIHDRASAASFVCADRPALRGPQADRSRSNCRADRRILPDGLPPAITTLIRSVSNLIGFVPASRACAVIPTATLI